MPRISVIIPVYNVEKYLRRCIDSVLSQTHTDFELLLVDDGSLDGSGAICDEYATVDSRVRVFHKQNGGASSARNIGIEKARGEFIYFIDADDIIYPQTLQILLQEINKGEGDVDVIVSDHVSVFRDKSIRRTISWCRESKVDRISAFFKSDDTAIWNILIRRLLIVENQLRFDTALTIGEDLVFLLQLVSLDVKYKKYDAVTYEYNNTNQNSATAVVGLRQLNAKADTYDTVCNYLLRTGLISYCKEDFYIKCIRGIQNLLLYPAGIQRFIGTCPDKSSYILKSSLSRRMKVLAFLVCHKITVPVYIFAYARSCGRRDN